MLQASTPSPLHATNLHNADKSGLSSTPKFEDGTGLFHWVERDLLLTLTNSDQPT